MTTNNYTFLPFLRKGLNAYISQSDKLGTEVGNSTDRRGSVNVNLSFERAKEGLLKSVRENFSFDLVSNIDVKGIASSAILQTVPLAGTVGFCNDYLACIEFFEEDLPWRYTPLTAADGKKLRPWMALILCKEGEFRVQANVDGSQVVTLNLTAENYNQLLPPINQLHLYAHVQLSVALPKGEGVEDKLNKLLTDDPEIGLSRIFAPRKFDELKPDKTTTAYTAFLIPSFELGRLSGLGEKTEGANIQTGAWAKTFEEQQKRVRPFDFPVYYQWSFSTGGDRFVELADKLKPLTGKEQKELPNSLSADLKNCNLPSCNLQSSSSVSIVDVAVACIQPGTEPTDRQLRHETDAIRGELKELLDLSPVFEENKLIRSGSEQTANMEEDPWIVPPIYGAKHALATTLDPNQKDWVSQLNLIVRHRAAGGLGKKVVQTYQEQFVQRAWLQVERINRLNQQLRERMAMSDTERATANKHVDTHLTKSRKAVKNVADISGLSTDSFIRTVNLSNQPDLTADTIVGNLDAVQTYDKLSYKQNVGVSESFMDTLLTPPQGDVTELPLYDDAARVVAFQDEVLNAAFNVKRGSHYEHISVNAPLPQSFSGLFGVRYNGLSYNHNTQEVTIKDDKHPFEFCSIGSLQNFCMSVLNNGDVQQILVWLSGFDDLDGDKDYYDNDCDLPSFMEKVHNYNRLHEGKMLIKYKDNELVKGSNRLLDNLVPVEVIVGDKEKKGFLLPDPTYQRIFGSFAKKQQADRGIGIRYQSSDDQTQRQLYFFPVSAVLGGNASCYLQRLSVTLSFFNVFKITQKKLITKLKWTGQSFDLDTNYHVGYLQDKYVKGSISKGYDLRNVDKIERGDHKFVMGTSDNPYKYMSRYNTLWYYKRLVEEKIKQNSIIDLSLFQPNQKVTVFYKEKKKFYVEVCENHVVLRTKKGGIHRICFHNSYFQGLLQYEKKKYYRLILQSGDGKTGLLPELNKAIEALDKFANLFYNPEVITIPDSDVNVYSAWDLVDGPEAVKNIATRTKNLHKVVERYGEEWRSGRKKKNEQSQPSPVIKPDDVERVNVIDASAEAQKKMEEVLKNYYSGIGRRDEVTIEALMRSKYPIMVYPEYPDPTYFYLRELSQRFILPSVDKLPENTISLFRNNTRFVEAFLSGMNTEMGRELLWREYPSDERGSYFRKFWDSEEDPTEESYWDVKRLHEWQGNLGENHAQGKKDLLIFAIKGELLQTYPQTFIYLTREPAKGYSGETVLLPCMSAWLNNDTYLVGFNVDAKDVRSSHYLTLQERDVALHFDYEKSKQYARVPEHSAEWASYRLHQPVIWATPCKVFLNS